MMRPGALKLYAGATRLLEPLAPLLLKRRLKRGKEDPFRIEERQGVASFGRPPGPLVWLHGASVGESLSHLPLVERFAAERPDLTVLVTSGTVTSAALLAQRLPPGVLHQYAPIDTPSATRRFAEHWRPSLGIFVESEIWPNLLQASSAVGARLALMAARISQRSRAGWDRFPEAAAQVFGLFDLITTQDEETAAWLRAHGIEVAGELDLKRVAAPLPVAEAALERLKAEVGARRVLVAASTHEGEEEIVAAVAAGLSPQPLLVVVPRHPERGADVAAALHARGFSVARRSAGEAITPDTTAYVADTLGELGLFYRAADAVVLGGSLLPGLTGHNPLEPARLKAAIVAGPHTASFAATYRQMRAAGSVLIASGEAELRAAVGALLAEPAVARALGERAARSAAAETRPFDDAWASLQALLPPP